MNEGTGQHCAALACGNEKAESVGQGAKLTLVINEVDGDRRRVRNGGKILGKRRVNAGQQRAHGPCGRSGDDGVVVLRDS